MRIPSHVLALCCSCPLPYPLSHSNAEELLGGCPCDGSTVPRVADSLNSGDSRSFTSCDIEPGTCCRGVRPDHPSGPSSTGSHRVSSGSVFRARFPKLRLEARVEKMGSTFAGTSQSCWLERGHLVCSLDR